MNYGKPEGISSQYYISTGKIRIEKGTINVPWALMMNLSWYDDLNNVCLALETKARMKKTLFKS